MFNLRGLSIRPALIWYWLLCILSLLEIFVAAEQPPNNTLPSNRGLADFGQVVVVSGSNQRTVQEFKDGLAVDVFSPKARLLVVQKNNAPLSGKFVTGSTGEPFVALSSYSSLIRTNDVANDLIANIALPYNLSELQQQGIDQSNTFVGSLAPDGRSWVISESQRNVQASAKKTRIVKLTSVDGEYILLGRKTTDTANTFVEYGQGTTRTVNLTGGPGIQEAEFVDGLRMTVETPLDLNLNADIVNDVKPSALPLGTKALNSFVWRLNSSTSGANFGVKVNAAMLFPVNPSLLQTLGNSTTSLATASVSIASRVSNGSSIPFVPFPAASQRLLAQTQAPQLGVLVTDLNQLDGDYVLLVRDANATRNAMSPNSNGTALAAMKESISATSSASHHGMGLWLLIAAICMRVFCL